MEKFCEYCGDLFETKVGHAKYCPPCRPEVQRHRLREQYRRTYKNNRDKAKAQAERDKPQFIEQGWMDLAFAVVEQAFRNEPVHDFDLLVRGGPNEIIAGDNGAWLEEFGMEFLAFSGRPINQFKFDNLLEEMNGQT